MTKSIATHIGIEQQPFLGLPGHTLDVENVAYHLEGDCAIIADTVNDSVGEIIEKLKGKVGSPDISGEALARE